jgi:ribosomal protein S18 acetylase RimI-like enzyme
MEIDARLDGVNFARGARKDVSLRILTADEWRIFRRVRLQALSEAPYAFGSTFASWQGAGDTEDRWRQRLTSVPFNIIAYFEGRPSGMVSATAPNQRGEVELISMWVAPFARGKGVADALVIAVIEYSKGEQIERISLEVMESNSRARAFYRRLGFVDQGESSSAPDGRPERRMLRG